MQQRMSVHLPDRDTSFKEGSLTHGATSENSKKQTPMTDDVYIDDGDDELPNEGSFDNPKEDITMRGDSAIEQRSK